MGSVFLDVSPGSDIYLRLRLRLWVLARPLYRFRLYPSSTPAFICQLPYLSSVNSSSNSRFYLSTPAPAPSPAFIWSLYLFFTPVYSCLSVYPCLTLVYLFYPRLFVFTYVNSCCLCLPLFICVFLCLAMLTHVYLCLPMFTCIYPCLLVFVYVYHSLLVLPYLHLTMLTRVYQCVLVFTYV